MNCRAFMAPVGFERRGYPGARLWWGVLPHGGLHGEGHEVQVAVAGQAAVMGQVAVPEAGLSGLVPGGFAQELGAVGVAFYEVPGGVVAAGDPGEELAHIHGLFLLVKLAGEIGDGVDGGPWLSVPAVWPGFVGGPPIFSAGARREGACSGVESCEPGGGARKTPGPDRPGVMNMLVRGWLGYWEVRMTVTPGVMNMLVGAGLATGGSV